MKYYQNTEEKKKGQKVKCGILRSVAHLIVEINTAVSAVLALYIDPAGPKDNNY